MHVVAEANYSSQLLLKIDINKLIYLAFFFSKNCFIIFICTVRSRFCCNCSWSRWSRRCWAYRSWRCSNCSWSCWHRGGHRYCWRSSCDRSSILSSIGWWCYRGHCFDNSHQNTSFRPITLRFYSNKSN